MKKLLFYCCLLLLPFLSVAQINTSIDIVGSYDFRNEQTYIFDVRDIGIKSRQNYRFGANFNFRVFDQGFIKTGIRYVKQIFRVFSAVMPDGSINGEYIDEYYIEVPIVYRYEFNKRKFSFYTEVGVSPHFFLKGKLVQQINEEITSTDYEIPYLKDRRVHLGFIFGVGFNYLLSKKMQLFVQPTYRYYPLIGKQSAVLTGTINLGVEFGVRRALNFVKEN